MTLYFPGDASNVLVPVTRMVYSEPDINTAVVELCKGPSAASPLENALPAGCGVIDVNVEDGVAKINFTGEFIDLAENSDGGRLALKALVLTCTQFDGIEGVENLRGRRTATIPARTRWPCPPAPMSPMRSSRALYRRNPLLFSEFE